MFFQDVIVQTSKLNEILKMSNLNQIFSKNTYVFNAQYFTFHLAVSNIDDLVRLNWERLVNSDNCKVTLDQRILKNLELVSFLELDWLAIFIVASLDA